MGADIKITGLDKLEKALKSNATLNDVKRIVRTNGAQMQNKIVRNANFKRGYQTGTTKRSVRLNITDGGMTAESGPTTEYSPYVEWGTRFMDAQPFVRPAYNDQKEKFKRDMDKLVK
ncbi:MAG: HK97-gp10 family putative phage morphogenesis protein [Thomasclavelia sp.]